MVPGTGVLSLPSAVQITNLIMKKRAVLPDDDAPCPEIALRRGRRRIVVIVEATGADDDEIAALAALTGREHADVVQCRALAVIGMVVRGHVVPARVVVDELHAASRRHRHLLRADSARRQRERVGIGGGIGRRGRRFPSAARRAEETQQQE